MSRFFHEGTDIAGIDAPSVDDPNFTGNSRPGKTLKDLPDKDMNVLGLFGRCRSSGPDCPDRFIGNQGLPYIIVGQILQANLELLFNNRKCPILLSLLQRFANAKNRYQAAGKHCGQFAIDEEVCFPTSKSVSPLGMSNNDVTAPDIGKHRRRNFSGKCALRTVMDILRRQFNRCAV